MKEAFCILTTMFALQAMILGSDDIFYGKFKLPNGKIANLLPPIRDQNQPKGCDASWAFAATTAMSIHFNIQNNGGFPETVLSPQSLINCTPASIPFKCNYGSNNSLKITDVFEVLKSKGVSDESCNHYHGDDTKECSDMNQCKDCHYSDDASRKLICKPIAYRAYKLAGYSLIKSSELDPKKKIDDLVSQISKEVAKGPLVCMFNHSEALFKYRTTASKSFVDDDKLQKAYTTYGALVGFGKFGISNDNQLVLQVSFSENIGHFGLVYLPIDSKINDFKILENCYTIQVGPNPKMISNGAFAGQGFSLMTDKGVKHIRTHAKISLNQGLIKLLPDNIPGEQISPLTGPADPIDWRNKDGVNYITYVKNQNIPAYCGSCWAQSTASVIAERLNIARGQKGDVFPKIHASVQAIINCKIGGSCTGGDPSMFFQLAQKWKVPSETCETYQAANPPDFDCKPDELCQSNTGTQHLTFNAYNGFRITNWGRLKGVQQMKTALQNGPIVCNFEVTDDFKAYKKIDGKLNIYNTDDEYVETNHAISIVGWGVEKDTQYWIVKNSWGREWGYDGFFYIKAGNNVLGIESACSWADVAFETYDR